MLRTNTSSYPIDGGANAQNRAYYDDVGQARRDIMRELEKRELARNRLIPFCQYIWPGFVTRPYRELIAASLEMLEARKITRLMVFCPPQWGKSHIVSRFFPAWYLGRHPDHNIILCSYASSLAEEHSYAARENIQEDGYKALFGDLSPYEAVELSDRAGAVKRWRLAPPHKGGLKAAGVGGGITGHACSCLIIDDPLPDTAAADSEITRTKQINWYKQSAYTRLSPDGVVVLVMTRWHDLDLAGYLLKEQSEGGDEWHVLRLPALAETEREIEEWCKRNNVTKDRYLVAARRKDVE